MIYLISFSFGETTLLFHMHFQFSPYLWLEIIMSEEFWKNDTRLEDWADWKIECYTIELVLYDMTTG